MNEDKYNNKFNINSHLMETDYDNYEFDEFEEVYDYNDAGTDNNIADMIKAARKGYKAFESVNNFVSGAFDKEISSTIRTHGFVAGAVLAFPLFGLDTILYAIVLWHMYSSICRIAQVPFMQHFWKNIFGGFISNLIVVFILNFILDFIPFAGWIGAAIVGFVSMYLSGTAFIEALKVLHGKDNVKTSILYSKGFDYMSITKSQDTIRNGNT